MVNLFFYIKELLLTHDCVVIPGFGGFICNYNSAKLDKARQTFIPPSKSLVFNKNLSTNDGLLLNYISNIENISYFEAKIKLDEQIKYLNSYLDYNKQVEIDEVGKLILDSGNNLLFEPIKRNNLFLNSFGLGEFTFPEIEKISQDIIEKNYSEKFRPQKKKRFNYSRLIIVPLAVAFLLTPFKTSIFDSTKAKSDFKIDTNYSYASNPVSEAIEKSSEKSNALMYSESTNVIVENKTANIDTVKAIVKNVVSEPVVEEKTKTVDEIAKVQINEVKKGNCYIIAGCFQDLSNAESLQNQFIKKGISAEIFLDKGLHRISLGNFETRKTADSELQKLRAIDNGLQAWVMVK
ncbi:MAG: hypothetical protein A2033_03130 [Bacteroidetes bacterium GWA2_31_9]|nr:MAG: hypothetical protein A2033_03130 [Bacteroidetes bacterium GWA2_31_9]